MGTWITAAQVGGYGGCGCIGSIRGLPSKDESGDLAHEESACIETRREKLTDNVICCQGLLYTICKKVHF